MKTVKKSFKSNEQCVDLIFSRKGNSIIVDGVFKDGRQIIKTSGNYTISKMKELYPHIKDFKTAEKIFYSLKAINKKNPSMPEWEKLKAVCAPKEGPDETYIFDEKSAGIYTPVLEGIARINGKRPSSDGYIRLAKDCVKKFEAQKDSDHKEAFRNIMTAYRLADLASHVAYYHNARQLKNELGSDKEVINKLLKLQDKETTNYREELFKAKNDYIQLLLEAKKRSVIEDVSSEFHLAPKAEVKVRKPLVQRSQQEILEDDENRIESIEESIRMFQNALKSSKLHPNDRKSIEAMLHAKEKQADAVMKRLNRQPVKAETTQEMQQ